VGTRYTLFGVNEKIILTEIGHTTLRMTRRYVATNHAGRRRKNWSAGNAKSASLD
jgi:hypothetical protein